MPPVPPTHPDCWVAAHDCLLEPVGMPPAIPLVVGTPGRLNSRPCGEDSGSRSSTSQDILIRIPAGLGDGPAGWGEWEGYSSKVSDAEAKELVKYIRAFKK